MLGVTWMPDGKNISFYDSPDYGSGEGEVRAVDLKTLQVKTVTKAANLSLPVTSPDGQHIAAATIDGHGLMLFDFGTGQWSELLKADVGWTTWSQDSRYIYFDTGLSENRAFYRVRIADRKLERLADLKGLRRVVLFGISWSGITPDGSPLLLRDTSSQEVYALDFEAP